MKKFALLLFIILLGESALIGAKEKNLEIQGDFPGGNIEIVSVNDKEAKVKIIPRGTNGHLFYWAFRLENAQNRSIKITFEDNTPISTRGPAVSYDNGRNWRWLSPPNAPNNYFEDKLGPDDSSVIYAASMLYLQSDFDRFYALIDGKANLVKKTLCETPRGRKTEMLRFGNLNGQGRYCVLLTARHHAREMTASHVLEGFIAEIFSGSPEGKYLLDNIDFIAVPFMDKDGVEDGEEGKDRQPHDHNRDYREQIYPSVKALTKLVPNWCKGKSLIALDFHCPYLRGLSSERVFFFCCKGGSEEKESRKYFDLFEKIHRGGAIPYYSRYNIYNIPNRGMSRSWFQERPETIFAATLEFPFANSDGQEVTQKSARDFGRDMAKSLKIFLAPSIPVN